MQMFDEQIASIYGVNGAIIIGYMTKLVRESKILKKEEIYNFEGRTCVELDPYDSFWYMGTNSIEKSLEELAIKGIISRVIHNDKLYYFFVQENLWLRR